MRLTQKIKNAIKVLKEIEGDSEKCENNYINLNQSKYYVFKNNLYKTQKYIKPVGTIKNGRIVLKRHKSIESLKNVQNGIRKIQSKSLKFKNKNNSKSKNFTSTFPDSPTPENPFSDSDKYLNTNNKSESFPFEKTEKFEEESKPFDESIEEETSEPFKPESSEPFKSESFNPEPKPEEKEEPFKQELQINPEPNPDLSFEDEKLTTM
jgi:hypothetical protein